MKKIFYVLLVSCIGLTIIISCKEGDDINEEITKVTPAVYEETDT